MDKCAKVGHCQDQPVKDHGFGGFKRFVRVKGSGFMIKKDPVLHKPALRVSQLNINKCHQLEPDVASPAQLVRKSASCTRLSCNPATKSICLRKEPE